MRLLLLACTFLPLLSGQESPAVHRAAAIESARRGDWRTAESSQRQALAACRNCTVEDRAVLRAELAGYLTLGGFPEAAVPLWKQSLAELAAGSPSRPANYLGLGVALHAAGKPAEARKAWNQACRQPALDPIDNAACRFNAASSWSEFEEILPVLLAAQGPLSRATALLATARAAATEQHLNRAQLLLAQADALIVAELHPQHPFRALVYDMRAQIAQRQGDTKQAKLWRKKAEKLPEERGWERRTISLDELKRKPR